MILIFRELTSRITKLVLIPICWMTGMVKTNYLLYAYVHIKTRFKSVSERTSSIQGSIVNTEWPSTSTKSFSRYITFFHCFSDGNNHNSRLFFVWNKRGKLRSVEVLCMAICLASTSAIYSINRMDSIWNGNVFLLTECALVVNKINYNEANSCHFMTSLISYVKMGKG